MDEGKLLELSAWITKAGLAGRPEIDMLDGYCERLRAAGLALAGGTVVIDTLHPLYEGHAIRWFRDQPETKRTEYGRTNRGEASESYRRSIYYRLLMGSETHLRCPLTPESVAQYSNLEASLAAGNTDYLGIMNKFAAEGTVGDMDCVYSGWETDRPEGFTDAEVMALRRLSPFLAMAMKCASLARIAQALVETYLGREAGRQVLSGRIERGIADRIEAVLWFSDLRGFTRITDAAEPAHIIPLLNDYAEAVVSAIQAEGGDVLKLIGDGVLAMFPAAGAGQGLRRGHRRRHGGQGARRGAERAPQRREPAGDGDVSGPAYRRGLLRQCRQPQPPRFHRRRPGRQRGQPHRRHVPLGRPALAPLRRLRRGPGRRRPPPRLRRPLRAPRPAAFAGAVHPGSGWRLT